MKGYQYSTTKHFDKQYSKLRPQIKAVFKSRVLLLLINPYDLTLNNHNLKGKYLGYSSINIGGDARALYKIDHQGRMIIFGFIGTHHQLYGK
jgi:addiction module RelE/StbE family toxin